MDEFLTVVGPNPKAPKALVLIPDIWGITDYTKATAETFGKDYQIPCYIMDYFYQLTNKPSVFDPQNDGDSAVGLMNQMRGEDFISIFGRAMTDIKAAQPNLEFVAVVGFCFGGRLAYLGGLDRLVTKIVSFYGGGANRPDFYMSKSAVESLALARRDDASLRVLAFFGTKDQSISPEDRKKTQELLSANSINYQAHEYLADHAYFQAGRPNYEPTAAAHSKAELDKFLLA